MCMLGLKFMSLMRSLLVVAISFAVTGCGRNQRMDRLYAERCLGCHGYFGRGDGAVAASLPPRSPHFRGTVRRKSTGQIRSLFAAGRGLLPALRPPRRYAAMA